MFRKHLALWISVLVLLGVLLVPQVFGANLTAVTSQPAAAAQSASTPTTTFVSTSAGATAAQNARENLSLVDLYRQVNASVVEVINLADAGQFSKSPVEQSLGSGFVWDANGHIVTNDHVVAGADALQVILADGTRVEAKLVGTDPSSDLAVIKVDPVGLNLQPVALAAMSDVAVGQDVVAIGTPYGHQGTMTVGIVSGLGRTISSQTDFSIPNAIQTDAAINPGNSGGPLLNLRGEVIGVNDQIESASGSNSGVGFAIPISVVQRVIPALVKDGAYEHAYLGISGSTYNNTWAKELNLPADAKGVYVTDVVRGAPAERAGLQGGTQDSGVLLAISMQGPQYLPSGGDLITAIDGRAISGMDDLMTYLSEQTAPGQTVSLTVIRQGGQQATLEVKLNAQPSNSRLLQTTS